MNFFSHPTAVIDPDSRIGSDTRIWHFSHIMAGAVIGAHCVIGQNVMVATGVIIGNQVKIQNNVSLYTGVICEDDVFVGPSVVFTNVINPRSFLSRKSEFKNTIVRKGATIGANATIICGTEIGKFAFVAAGAVVTNPVPPYALVLGNPARQSGWVSEYGHRLEFGEDGVATCPESRQQYAIINGQVQEIK